MEPTLRPLHSHLVQVKIDAISKLSSEDIKHSLAPGSQHSLKVRPDGVILDGHHRFHVLRTRGENVDNLPGEIRHKTFQELGGFAE